MELAGDEKKIQALFSELSREDAHAAPRFDKLWRDASPAKQVPLYFRRSLLVVAAALIVAVTVLFVALSTKSTRDKSPEQKVENVAPQPIANPAAVQTPEPDNKIVQRRTPSHSIRRRTLARRQPPERALQQQAALLASWKSPTENFMTSPTPSVFGSLPQLNESTKDLETFLSKKESN